MTDHPPIALCMSGDADAHCETCGGSGLVTTYASADPYELPTRAECPDCEEVR